MAVVLQRPSLMAGPMAYAVGLNEWLQERERQARQAQATQAQALFTGLQSGMGVGAAMDSRRARLEELRLRNQYDIEGDERTTQRQRDALFLGRFGVDEAGLRSEYDALPDDERPDTFSGYVRERGDAIQRHQAELAASAERLRQEEITKAHLRRQEDEFLVQHGMERGMPDSDRDAFAANLSAINGLDALLAALPPGSADHRAISDSRNALVAENARLSRNPVRMRKSEPPPPVSIQIPDGQTIQVPLETSIKHPINGAVGFYTRGKDGKLDWVDQKPEKDPAAEAAAKLALENDKQQAGIELENLKAQHKIEAGRAAAESKRQSEKAKAEQDARNKSDAQKFQTAYKLYSSTIAALMKPDKETGQTPYTIEQAESIAAAARDKILQSWGQPVATQDVTEARRRLDFYSSRRVGPMGEKYIPGGSDGKPDPQQQREIDEANAVIERHNASVSQSAEQIMASKPSGPFTPEETEILRAYQRSQQ